MPPRRLGGARLSLWPGGSATAVGGGWSRPPFSEGVLEKRTSRGGEGGQGEVDGVDVGPPCRSKPSTLCSPGCYPRCPKHSPIYDEELKACVTRDQCGCYINNTRYTPGTSVPTGHICHSWYLSSRLRGPGRLARTHTCMRIHAPGEGRGGPCCLCTLASSLLCPHWEPRRAPELAFGAVFP